MYSPPAREEEQAHLRQQEEENWSKALSGELSGPRKAAVSGQEKVIETQKLAEGLVELLEDRNEDLYTAMYKGKPHTS